MEVTRPAIAQLESVVQDIPGWSPIDQLYSLYLLTLAASDVEGDVMEIGSWCGRSAVTLGLAALQAGVPAVHCVDLFPERDHWYTNEDGSHSFKLTLGPRTYASYVDQRVWDEPFQRDIAPLYKKDNGILDIFNRVIAQKGVADVVRPFRGDAADFFAATGTNRKFRLAFLDGDHGYEAVSRDIQLTTEHLAPGGWICLDDAFSSYEGVDQAIRDHLLASPLFDVKQQLTRKCFAARRKAR